MNLVLIGVVKHELQRASRVRAQRTSTVGGRLVDVVVTIALLTEWLEDVCFGTFFCVVCVP